MPVQFVCPSCAQLLSVGSRKVGTQVACPRCQRSLTVPDLETAAASVAMRQSQRASTPDFALPEFMVFDEPAETADPPIAANEPPRAIAPLREPPQRQPRDEAAAWWRRAASGEPMLLISRRTLYLQAGILAAATLAAFGLGYLFGRGAAPPAAGNASQQAGEATVVEGFIRYTAAGGESRGDSGSIVIALPEARLPTPKLGVQGLRPADPAPAPGGGVLMSLELLGGASTRVADDGSYSLPISEPGRYFLLYLSRHAQRAADQQPDEFQLALMQRYFQPAKELIGAQKFLWRIEDLPAGVTHRSQDFGPTEAK